MVNQSLGTMKSMYTECPKEIRKSLEILQIIKKGKKPLRKIGKEKRKGINQAMKILRFLLQPYYPLKITQWNKVEVNLNLKKTQT